jgi:hypothetical protein
MKPLVEAGRRRTADGAVVPPPSPLRIAPVRGDPPRPWPASSRSRTGLAILERDAARGRRSSRPSAWPPPSSPCTGRASCGTRVVEPGSTPSPSSRARCLVRRVVARAGRVCRGDDRSAARRSGGPGRARVLTDVAAGLRLPGPSVAARQPLLVAPRPPLLGAGADDRGLGLACGARADTAGPWAHSAPSPSSPRELPACALVERRLRQRALPARAAALRPRPGLALDLLRTDGAAAAAAPGGRRGGALVPGTSSLMAQYRAELIPRDDTVSFPAWPRTARAS